MRKLNYFLSILLVIFMSFTIMFLSSNLVLRTSAMYSFHFNDSEVMYDIPYNVTGSDMSKEIASYWWSLDSEPFQVYEDNRIFKDPIFEKTEQEAMGKAKIFINLELVAGVLCLVGFLGIYIYMLRKNFKEALRNRFRCGMIITLMLLVGRIVFLCIKSCRLWAYKTFIGVELSKNSTLSIILGDPLFKTYLIFGSIIGVALLAVMAYVHFNLTKPERIFY